MLWSSPAIVAVEMPQNEAGGGIKGAGLGKREGDSVAKGTAIAEASSQEHDALKECRLRAFESTVDYKNKKTTTYPESICQVSPSKAFTSVY
ncbi:hypothetical protein L1887_06142 [Cichorium endivia]|nr:hypothetical protein L1887_06142 [Cichorium endivia]